MDPGETLSGNGIERRKSLPVPGRRADRVPQNIFQTGSADLGHQSQLAVGTPRGLTLARMNWTMSSMDVPGWKMAATPAFLRFSTSWLGIMPPATHSTS